MTHTTKLSDVPHFKPRGEVRCVQTGEVFESVAIASKALGLNESAVRTSALGTRKSAVEGFTFEYVHDQSYSIRGRRLL